MREQVLLLDGSNPGGADLGAVRTVLQAELERRGAEVRAVSLKDEALAPCRGCFGCWVATPGLCRSRDRSGPLLEAMLASTVVVLLTPATFGGYSSSAKRFVDHWIQTTLPYFRTFRGETHHPLRYRAFPRLVAVGVSDRPDPAEERLLQAIVARNGANFSAPSCSAGVVSPADPLPGLLRILDHNLPMPCPPFQTPAPVPWRDGAPGQALLLVGSPKTGSGSTSAVLGDHVLGGLAARGWVAERLKLAPDLVTRAGQERLFQAAEKADLIILAFPLYIDSLPFLATLALEHLAGRPLAGKGLAALVNNGFPEARQNELAVAICARFAAASGMAWAGSLALGAGEALSSGLPLHPRHGLARPPVTHVVKALDLAVEALAAGRPVPAEASALVDRSPIPGLPFGLWVRLFRFMGERGSRSQARANGVADLRARPLAP